DPPGSTRDTVGPYRRAVADPFPFGPYGRHPRFVVDRVAGVAFRYSPNGLPGDRPMWRERPDERPTTRLRGGHRDPHGRRKARPPRERGPRGGIPARPRRL